MTSATSFNTIARLQTLFAQFRLSDIIVSDNGSCFVSQEFENYISANGIRHLLSAPYHPATNGLAERLVQMVKNGLKRVTSGTLSNRLATVLFNYRVSPHSTTNVSPAELLFQRKLKSKLDLVKPDMASRVETDQFQRLVASTPKRDLTFNSDEKVYYWNFRRGPVWLPGVISTVCGPVSFIVKTQDGQLIRKHIDHIRRRTTNDLPPPPDNVCVCI